MFKNLYIDYWACHILPFPTTTLLTIFEDVKQSPIDVADFIMYEVASWAVASKVFEGLSINDFTRDWKACIFSYSLQYIP